ncbi:MAG: hypothetical protein ACO3R2_15860 [bacterium]
MKRALAERVKQERLGSPVETPSANGASHQTFVAKPPPELSANLSSNGGNVSQVDHIPQPSSTATSHPNPPQSMDTGPDPSTSQPSVKKRPRSPNATSSGNISSFTEEPARKRPGRPRKSTPAAPESDSDDEGDPTRGPFYLKHQNAALASELYAYRRRIYLLEREREWRRKECGVVGERVRMLDGVWRGMEEWLGLVSLPLCCPPH